ncbi:hypothetical protein DZB54_20385 [Herbaspirillum sp. 3R-3a1]|nr:hypothetical protein DZB54_20385 [Herbaspirillum sp. 3R-3a1]
MYVSQLDYREASDKVIAEAQASLASSVIGGVNAENIEASKQKPIETVFGFICKNPWEGIAKGSAKGSLCTKFTACATCPGAIIPLDDIAVVAKLLKTLEQLKDTYARAINEGWLERFKIFYEPTQRILEQELLPHVSHQVLRSAQKIVSQNQIPYLE